MSRSFIRLFTIINKHIFNENICTEKKGNDELIKIGLGIKLFFLGTITSSHCAYAISTNKKDVTTIKKKYTMVRNGFTEFMIIDNKGRHFNINNSLWYWKWNSIEDWHKIKEGAVIKFKYYGWRIPLFGLFPNIYMSDSDKFSDSMPKSEIINFGINNKYNSL